MVRPMLELTDKTHDLVAIGNAIVDVLSHADDEFLALHGMVKGAMQLIEDEVVHRLYADMGPAIEASGGSAANTAAGFASFGGSAAFIGRVAADGLGEVFTHDIRATGVHFDPLRVGADGDGEPGGDPKGTARCLILVTPDAQRTLNTYLGVSSLIGPDDVDATLVADSRIVYCEGYLWDLPDAKAAMIKAMDVAHDTGGKVAFTLSDGFCVDRHRADFLELAEHRIDVLFANEVELLSLYETATWEEAAERVAGHCQVACLTRSEHGSVIITDAGERIAVPAHPVDEVVDTTGAGDLYAAGFLYGHTHGLDLEASGRLGSAAAAEVISHLGARPEIDLIELTAALDG